MASDLTTASDRRRRGHPVRWAVVGVSVVVLLPLVVVLGSRLGKDPTLGQRSAVLNKPVPEFSLPNIDGGTVSSKDLVGRPYLVNFWASWCAPCRQEHQNLEALYARYRSQGMELLGVLWNDTPDGARSYRRDMGGGWPILRDPDEKLAVDFGVTGPPETFLVDDTGVIRYKVRGAVTRAHLQAIQEALTQLGLG
jgi:cytochrome c biogenesis protein CcmG, thiol:disulfide interchange protein DsbE